MPFFEGGTGDGGGGTGVDPTKFSALCASGDAIGTLVALAGNAPGGTPVVTTADPSNSAKMPAVGLITAKASATDCEVTRAGILDLSPYGVTTLTPGKRIFVWGDAMPHTLSPGNYLTGSGYAMVQVIGIAISSQDVELRTDLLTERINTTGKPTPPSR